MPTIDDYKTFFENLRKQTGLEMLIPDDDGLVSIRVDDQYNVNLQFVATSEKILCFVEVTTLPSDAGIAVYRDLLAGTLFGKDTAGGYFALEEESNTIIYNYLFDFDKAVADPESFIETLENILQLVNVWADRINGNQENEDSEESTPFTNPPHLSNMFFRP